MGKHHRPLNHPPQGRVRRFLSTPKGYVLATLLALMVIGAVYKPDRPGVIHVGAALATALVVDLVVSVVRRHQRWLSDGGAVTGIIVGLILSPSAHVSVVVLTTAVAVLSKHVLKSGRKPIFNPAAVGLLVATFAFSVGQSWWGDLADLPVWCVVLLLAAGYLVVHRVNKFPQVLSFLGTYFVLLTITGYLQWGHAAYSPGDALRTPLISCALFMAFFMLTDPPTSPAKYGDQVWFGVIAAVIGTGVYLLFGGLTYLLIGLLAANGWKAWRGRRTSKPKRVNEPMQAAQIS
ncbi:RnfABCDGE type electron transport complex subunit D [Alicyclobacillus cycloheptanicus]|uniref:Na+-translocating ferredoxin:NAD+ oxidoreductase RnfD subunit n=1 Tax=Alicyclobacillus cycloheptanicus TaxID=1457 RepID=A0ABT9XH39_9BACL|nr:RnfABCDGE type electron transport complex subunit D [Alicyclobacillus cycloheptanicus]MDQ0189598.1 Na+-translocating ferredoxin:NAD+ oxidoreductase RnfD subunit [Alicyclobacillus cycloheptanicus]WDL99908.1 RnfABCDGE type electron transport complex subunit D [Alicyclobacillus cycloheptanicus]